MNWKKLTIVLGLSLFVFGCKIDTVIKPCNHIWGSKEKIKQFLDEPCAQAENWDLRADE